MPGCEKRGPDNLLVTISEATKLFLAGGIPNVHENGAEISVKLEWVNLDTHGSEITLFEFTGDMPLHKGGFTNTTITDKDDLEGWHLCVLRWSCHLVVRKWEGGVYWRFEGRVWGKVE